MLYFASESPRPGLVWAGMDRLTNIPLFPLNTVLFPGMTLPLRIFEPRYVQMLERCLDEKIPFGVVLIRSGREVGEYSEPHEVGTLARIDSVQPSSRGDFRVTAMGTQRFRIEGLNENQPYLQCDLRIDDVLPADDNDQSVRETAQSVAVLFEEYFRLSLVLAGQWQDAVKVPEDTIALTDFVAARLVTPMDIKQAMLEESSVSRRLQMEADLLSEAIPVLNQTVRQRQLRRWGTSSSMN